MPRPSMILIGLTGAGVLLAVCLLFQNPGSLSEALLNPIQTLLGTQRQLNSTLLEVSETAEPVRSAGRRLLQPFGIVHLDRVYDTQDTKTKNKN